MSIASETVLVRLALIRHRDFVRLWTAQTISVFGDQFTKLAVPIIAILTLGASPAQMGILSAVQTAPSLLMGLFVGVWVDRLPRRRILVLSDLGRALLLATVALLAFAGLLRIPHLYLAAFLVGILTVFFDVTYQAYVPIIVGRDQLVEGNSKLEATRSLAELAGPSIAGVVIQTISAAVAMLVDALSFLASGLFVARIRSSEAPSSSTRSPLLTEVGQGVRFVIAHPLLRAIAASTATLNLFHAALFALYVLFAARTLGLGPASIGLIFGLSNVPSLIGAVYAGHLASRFGLGRVIMGSLALNGVAFLPLIVATPATAFPLLTIASVLAGLAIPIYNINQVSLRQAITPVPLQGRMAATMRFLVWGALPIGGLLGGYLGELLGLRAAIDISILGRILAFLWILLSPVMAVTRMPSPHAAD